jgi:hypothetical protein
LFGILQLTETDLERSGRYQSDARRRASFQEAGSTQAFLNVKGFLETGVEIIDPWSA